MNIKTELLKKHISDYITKNIDDFEIDVNDIANTVAIEVLSEIKRIIINDDLDEFDIVERITDLFEEYGIDFGNQHDF